MRQTKRSGSSRSQKKPRSGRTVASASSGRKTRVSSGKAAASTGSWVRPQSRVVRKRSVAA